jgi:hypothetical protein
MARLQRTLALLALILVAQAAVADQTSVALNAFPSLSVADGRSTTSITAQVRDSEGRAVADGTKVIFETTLGSFRESVVTTINGFARGVLVSSGTPGVAHITATAVRADSVPTQITYEFVANKSLLKAATQYIEVVSGTSLLYSLDNQFITASSPATKADPNGGVFVRFNDIVVQSDDIQLSQDYELRARRAYLTIGHGKPKYYHELYLRLNVCEGVGLSSYPWRRPTMFAPFGTRGFLYLAQDRDNKWVVAPQEERYGTINITRAAATPSKIPVASPELAFVDLTDSPSMIGAKRAVVFPRREIQFQRAEIYVQGARVMRVPLYDLNLGGMQQAGLVTGGILSVNDNQVDINYPQYLSLRPGLTSLLRFQTGNTSGTSADTKGLFLNYELNWNRGEGMEGGLTVAGIARSDWSIGIKQFLQVDERTSINADVQFPQAESFLGYMNTSSQLNGFRLSTDLNASRTFTGIQYGSQSYGIGLDKNPIKMGKFPVSLTLGLTADRNENTLLGETQQGAGVRASFQSNQINLGEKAVLTSSLSFTKLFGENELAGVGMLGSVSISRPLFTGARATIGYTYTHDGYNDSLVGEHSFNYNANYSKGKFNAQISGSRGLDVESTLVNANGMYTINRLWSLTSNYSFQRYLNSEFLDYGFGFAYHLGMGPLSRGLGLVWNYRTQRLGFQLVGSNGF